MGWRTEVCAGPGQRSPWIVSCARSSIAAAGFVPESLTGASRAENSHCKGMDIPRLSWGPQSAPGVRALGSGAARSRGLGWTCHQEPTGRDQELGGGTWIQQPPPQYTSLHCTHQAPVPSCGAGTSPSHSHFAHGLFLANFHSVELPCGPRGGEQEPGAALTRGQGSLRTEPSPGTGRKKQFLDPQPPTLTSSCVCSPAPG